MSAAEVADPGAAPFGADHEGVRFAAYIAHELRTPLATQRALLELALADPTTDPHTWREIGEDVLRACRQQEGLIEAGLILAMSRCRFQPGEPVDLAAMLDKVLRAHDLAELQPVVALEHAWTTGVPELLEWLVANLLSNASRHNLPGGRIEVATHTEAGRASLSISNTGPLIPAGELHRLFQPFQRLTKKPGVPTDGLGLGLSIVQEIANVHGAILTTQPQAEGGLHVEVSFRATDPG